MRALGLETKIAGACAAAVALLLALGLPWYGAIPSSAEQWEAGDLAGPLDGVFSAIPRWVTERSGMTGWEMAGPWDTALAGAGALALVAATLCLLPAAEHAGRALLQLAALAAVGIVVVKLGVRPDGMEPRYGLFVALAVAILLLITSQGIAAAKLRRKPLPPRRYAGSKMPAPYEHGSSVAPPGS